MKSHLILGSAALLGLAAGLGPLAPSAHSAGATIPVSEIHEGMKGYGLTVFHGTTPERFNVEVLGVLHNFRPGQDLIVIRTPHPRLDIVKTVAGMSGSPIYLDGRLAGAYSYSLSRFEAEPIAGVTPIAPMLAEMARPIPPGFWPLSASGPLAPPPLRREPRDDGLTLFHGAPGSYDLEAHAGELAARLGDPRGAQYVRASTPLMMAGFGDKAAAAMKKLLEPLGLEPLQTGGGRDPRPEPPSISSTGEESGSSLVRGDVSMMGLGTVTHVVGTKLVAFGHPMMNSGDSALPTSIGRVLWVNASIDRSFKVGETARQLGTLIQDRQSAIVVDETKRAPVFPVSIDIVGAEGAPKKSWHAEVALDRFMGPNLAAGAIGSAIEATISEQRDVTWELDSQLSVRGHGVISLQDFGVAEGGMPDQGEIARSRLVRAIGDVLNNPWEDAYVDRVDARLTVRFAREVLHLRGVSLEDEVVDAGRKARVNLRLIPFEGRETVRQIELPMPPELAGTEPEIEILPGYEVTPDVPSPENLSQMLVNETRQGLLPKSIVLEVKIPAPGVVLHGALAPELPAFAFDALKPLHADDQAEAIATYFREVVPMDAFVVGKDKLKVKVRRAMR